MASKLNIFVALAPVAYVSHTESLLVKAMAELDVGDLFDLLGVQDFSLPTAIDKLLAGICKKIPNLCSFELDLVMGPTTYFNKSMESFYLQYEPNPTSVKNMIHWSQGVKANKFQMFDYGSSAANQQHYGQPTPPQYQISDIPSSLNVAIFNGGNDYLADPADVDTLLSQLATPPYQHYESEYAHLDPLLGTNAYIRIYPLVLQLLEKQVAR